jgi:hypothetical protein
MDSKPGRSRSLKELVMVVKSARGRARAGAERGLRSMILEAEQ